MKIVPNPRGEESTLSITVTIAERALEVVERVAYLAGPYSTDEVSLDEASSEAVTINLHRATRLAIEEIVSDRAKFLEYYRELRLIYNNLPGYSEHENPQRRQDRLEDEVTRQARAIFGTQASPRPWQALQQLLVEPSLSAAELLMLERGLRDHLEGLHHQREEALRLHQNGAPA